MKGLRKKPRAARRRRRRFGRQLNKAFAIPGVKQAVTTALDALATAKHARYCLKKLADARAQLLAAEKVQALAYEAGYTMPARNYCFTDVQACELRVRIAQSRVKSLFDEYTARVAQQLQAFPKTWAYITDPAAQQRINEPGEYVTNRKGSAFITPEMLSTI